MNAASAPPGRHSPAADRNKGGILEVLRGVLGTRGTALEIASGTGQHVACFAAGLSGWTWQPSDRAPEPEALARLDADIDWYRAQERADHANVLPSLALDVLQTPWPPLPRYDAIYCANMLHIAPWNCCQALFEGAARHLKPNGVLITYGPYFEDQGSSGRLPAAGNVAFDADLRARNPQWGIRQLADVEATAARAGLRLQQRHAMPANNLCLVFGSR